MAAKRPLVLVGAGEYGQIAHEYFTHDSDYEVVAFCVEAAYRNEDSLLGLPVVTPDELLARFPPQEVHAHVAITYTQLNRVRARLYARIKAMGYTMANYISSRAFVWRNVSMGDNVFIFENNVVQHQCQIGNNVVLWSGNHIGHQSVVEDHCYISSHVVVSGYCRIGTYSFLGVNATLADHVVIGRDCLIGAGAIINKDTEPGKIYQSPPAEPAKVGSLRFFRVKDE